MASYVDKYFFALMLDAKGFKQGADTAMSAISGIKNAFLKTYSLLGGLDLFKNMLTSYTTTARSIDQLNLMTGINTRDMQAWQKTIQDTGGDINAFNGTLARLADMQAQIKRYGTAEGLGEFLRIGVDVRGKSPIEILKDVNKVLKSVKDAPEAFNIAKRIGIDESSFRVMRLYGENLEKVVNTNKRYAVMSRQDLLNARQYEKIVSDFKTAWLQLSQGIMSEVLPVLQKEFFPVLKESIDILLNNRGAIKDFATTMSDIIKESMPLVKGVVKLLDGALFFIDGILKVNNAFNEYAKSEAEKEKNPVLSKVKRVALSNPAYALGNMAINKGNSLASRIFNINKVEIKANDPEEFANKMEQIKNQGFYNGAMGAEQLGAV